jgi:hypothetical protein
MRLSSCVLIAVLTSSSLAVAQTVPDKPAARPKKPSETPNLNLDYTARFSADESQLWRLPDPTGTGLKLRNWGDDNRPAGLTISRPFN